MKLSTSWLATISTASALAVIPGPNIQDGRSVRPQLILQEQPLVAPPQMYLVETAPGETKWVDDEGKLALLRKDVNFIDITDEPRMSKRIDMVDVAKVKFPEGVSREARIRPLLGNLDIQPMRSNLQRFSSFQNRYYKSQYGAESSRWLLGKVNEVVKSAGSSTSPTAADRIKVRAFEHSWGQHSIIATIPGRTNKTVVIGAHQDSINMRSPMTARAPGADDDGSGSVTILEALRVLLKDKDIVAGKAENTVEFHWYSAEEGGLLGSQAIFRNYAQKGRDVRAMLQQDMTGFTARTKAAGKPPALGVITDYVDAGLTKFITKVIDQYCDIPYVLTKCGYACSDHASASRNGYPSAFIIEGEMQLTHDKIHTEKDTIDLVDFDHVLQHAKMTLALAYELAFADLPKTTT